MPKDSYLKENYPKNNHINQFDSRKEIKKIKPSQHIRRKSSHSIQPLEPLNEEDFC